MRIHDSLCSNIFQVRLPILEIIFRIVEDLTSFIGVLVWVSLITRDNWGIIEEIEEATAVTGKDDLLFGTFDRCGELGCVCLLQFLPGLQLSVIRKAGHERENRQCWSIELQQPNFLPLL